MIISFLLFLLLFTAIGLSSVLKSKGTNQDYYLASQGIKPWLVGLSAVATNNSGYMFIGVIGYTYATGLASIWLMIGWILGDFLASLFVHRKLSEATKASQEISYASVLASWHGEKNIWVKRIIGAISVVFLLVYASAQLTAGSKALFVLLDWPQWTGAIIGALIVAGYCYAGGIRASIWTDAAQSFVMIIAMGLLLVTAISSFGGVNNVLTEMHTISGFIDLFPKDLAFAGLLGGMAFAASWTVAGFSVVGQPHIMVRFMTLDNTSHINSAKAWYYLWFTAFYCMATAVGMLSRIFIPETSSFDAELALPSMAVEILPGFFVGIILAGIFAATMSTADSLILSCSAAISHDLSPKKIENNKYIKLVTLVVIACALIIALFSTESVFNLVIFAWSGMASAFAPLLVVHCLGYKPSQHYMIAAILSGLFAAIAWRLAGMHGFIYEGVPGMALGLIVLFFGQIKRKAA